MENTKDNWTKGTLFDGRLIFVQPAQGYRFTVDSALLAAFACEGKRARRCADLGAGCGVVGISILAAGGCEHLVGVEYQEELARCFQRNADENSLLGACDIIKGDLVHDHPLLPVGSFDLVVTNPPYRAAGEGRPSPSEQRNIACHENKVTLAKWTRRAAKLLHPKRGRLCAVFPARRVDSLLHALVSSKLGLRRLVTVSPREGGDAELILVEAQKSLPGHVASVSHFALKDARGDDTDEARRILSGGFSETLDALEDTRTVS